VRSDGSVTQYKPNLQEAKTYPCPPQLALRPVSIFWASTYEFFVGYQVLLSKSSVRNNVADPDPEPGPEGSETFGRIRIRSGTDLNISDPKLDPKKIYKKEPYFQAETRWFHMILRISHLKVVATTAVQ
jgi:hypothetical protein